MKSIRSFPPFLQGIVDPKNYERWLSRKAVALARRDIARGHQCTAKDYRDLIHAAVLRSDGKDEYTGEALDWTLISTYDNAASKEGRHAYKGRFALLPTVDHEQADALQASFRICGWRTNDSKNDLTLPSFLELCEKALLQAGYRVEKPKP